MADLPFVQQQDTNENSGRYRTFKLPTVLPEMQNRKPHKCKTTKYISYQRAGRKDAEPITCEIIITVIGIFL